MYREISSLKTNQQVSVSRVESVYLAVLAYSHLRASDTASCESKSRLKYTRGALLLQLGLQQHAEVFP